LIIWIVEPVLPTAVGRVTVIDPLLESAFTVLVQPARVEEDVRV
jgi:hypothetical protein